MAPLARDGPIGVRAIGPVVVGQDPFDRDPLGSEHRQRRGEGRRRAGATLVGDLDDDQASAPIVDDHLEVVVAEAGSMGMRGVGPAERPVRATIGDPAELLVILVDEGTRMADLVATDGQAGRPVDVG